MLRQEVRGSGTPQWKDSSRPPPLTPITSRNQVQLPCSDPRTSLSSDLPPPGDFTCKYPHTPTWTGEYSHARILLHTCTHTHAHTPVLSHTQQTLPSSIHPQTVPAQPCGGRALLEASALTPLGPAQDVPGGPRSPSPGALVAVSVSTLFPRSWDEFLHLCP